MIYIGIDPGVETGIAIWYSKDKVLTLFTLSFWEAINLLHKLSEKNQIKAILEDPNLNKPIFHKKGVDNEKKARKVAQNVGSNKRDAQLINEFLKIHNIETIIVKPTTTKWKTTFFRQVTGYKGHASQHAIDAARMVYGR